MPFNNAPACNPDDDCAVNSVFPVTSPTCVCETAAGGINELYFIPCSETMSQVNVTSLSWWQGLITANTLGRSGLGIGSIGKKAQTTAKVASCRREQITGITWALKYIQKCFDKTSARSHCAKMNALIGSFASYLVIARMCDGTDTVLPIGVFTTSDFDWVVPEDSLDAQNTMVEVSWNEMGMPCTVDVAGLSTILPKLS